MQSAKLMAQIDETHSSRRTSWVRSANGHPDFPIHNLPIGVFSAGGGERRGGVAIGDGIFDIAAAADAHLFSGDARVAARAAAGDALNDFVALDAPLRRAFRRRVSELLAADGGERARVERRADRLIHRARAVTLHLPVRIGSYTDFFAGIHHARNGVRRRDPGADLAANYQYVPIAYHGRHSSIVPSGTAIRRPRVQYLAKGEATPSFGPTSMLDFELEMAVWVGRGNELGRPAIAKAGDHIGGYGLFNDWSARDTQTWESTLGPFIAKNFASVVSPWIVTPEALAPFAVAQPPRPEGDPKPLPHLFNAKDQKEGAHDIVLEALISTPEMRARKLAPHRLALSSSRHLYWTPAQMVAHHTSGGCNLSAGDLFGTGTISAPEPEGFGCLAELTWGGESPLTLPSGETRSWLEDGDEIILRGHAVRDGFARIGFGECVSRVMKAR